MDLNNSEIPSEITTLLILAPTFLTEMEKFRIDQFILKGGNVIIGASGFDLDFRSGKATPISEDLSTFFSNYGIQFSNKMIVDLKNYVPFQFIIPYPVWLSVEIGSSSSHLITDGIPGLFIPWASSLTVDPSRFYTSDKKKSKDKIKDNTNYILAKSSPDSSSMSLDVMSIDPKAVNFLTSRDLVANKNIKTSSHDLVSFTKEKYYSYFKDKKLPKEANKNFINVSEKEASILVVSTPFFFSNPILQQAQRANLANINLVLGALDVMHGLDELVNSRKKNVSSPIIGQLKPWTKNALISTNFIIPLFMLGIYAFVHLTRRKKLGSLKYSK